jgi:hypothetical protein
VWKARARVSVLALGVTCFANDEMIESVDYVLTDNQGLNDTSALFQMPVITRSTIESDGYGT